jgi:hypothetical protein
MPAEVVSSFHWTAAMRTRRLPSRSTHPRTGRDQSTVAQVQIPVITQDPERTPSPVPVLVRGPLLAGPIGERMAVFDYHVDRDVVFPAATPRKDGSFPAYDITDVRFHQLNAYAIAARATELVELELGRPLRWGFDGSRLLVVPHAGILENAFYSSESHSLQFYSFMRGGRRRRPYHTALAHDIVAHETGHAILDAVRPRYYEPFEPETSALHEAFGDLCAVFAALSHESVQRRVVRSLDRLNLLSEIAEGFEESGARGWGSIRSLVTATPSDWKDTIEPHDLSLKLSSTIYMALRAFHRKMRRDESQLAALRRARTVVQRMVVRALDFLPPADCTIAEVAEAILAADRSAKPSDDRGYRQLMRSVLARRGLVSARDRGVDPSPWRAYPRSWPRPSVRDAYLFLDANRDRLALFPHAAQRDFVVRDVQLKRLPASPGEVTQVAMVYEYPVDIRLSEAEAEIFGDRWITLRGGGTLVFDALGRLLHEAKKPVTRERVSKARKFLRDAAEDAVTSVGVEAEDDVRRTAARRPWIAQLTGDRLALRSNLSAACGRSRRERR